VSLDLSLVNLVAAEGALGDWSLSDLVGDVVLGE
jgi:hypothetical protein